MREEIPTLDEVLTELPPCVINIEFKSSQRVHARVEADAVIEPLVTLLSKETGQHRLVFSTFDHVVAWRLPDSARQHF